MLLWVEPDHRRPPGAALPAHSGPRTSSSQRYREADRSAAPASVRAAVAVAVRAHRRRRRVVAVERAGSCSATAASFGIKDPQFHKDIGFYVFQLPFLSFLVDWLFVAIVIIADRHRRRPLPQRRHPPAAGAGERVTPQVKAHLSVLLGRSGAGEGGRLLAAALRAGDVPPGHRRRRRPTPTSTRSCRPSACCCSSRSFAFVLLHRQHLAPGLGAARSSPSACGRWWPSSSAAPTRRSSSSSGCSRPRSPRSGRTSTATSPPRRAAFGLDRGTGQRVPLHHRSHRRPTSATTPTPFATSACGTPTSSTPRSGRLQEIRAYYQFNDVDVDRYVVNGQLTQVDAGRPRAQPEPAAAELVGQRAPPVHPRLRRRPVARQRGDRRRPARLPGQGRPARRRPRRSPNPASTSASSNAGYAIVHTGQKELDFQSATGSTETSSYTGTGGVALNSFIRRSAFALRFGDFNLLISNQVTSTSKVLYIRNIRDRVRKVAPFLRYDSDPYPVVLNGRILWVQDAYTTTNRYPYCAAGRQLRAARRQRARRRVQLRPQLGQGRHRRLRRHDEVLRDRHQRPDHQGLQPKAFPSLFTPSVGDARRAAPTTSATPRTCSGCRPTCTAATTSPNPNDFYNQADAWNVAQNPAAGRRDADEHAGQRPDRGRCRSPRHSATAWTRRTC